MKKFLGIVFLGLLWCNVGFAEKCETSNPEIIVDLGGDPKPEKIVYMRDTICEGSNMYCGSGGCALDVFDDKGTLKKSYLSPNNWYLRPSESNYENPTKNSFELIMPMSQTYCLENIKDVNCARVIKVISNQITESIEYLVKQ